MIQINSMKLWRQRGLTARKGHKISWQTYNSVEEREKKEKKNYISIPNYTNTNEYIIHYGSLTHVSLH